MEDCSEKSVDEPRTTWTVVCFIEEATVEAVPTSWIVGDLCHFPVTTKEKTTAAITKNDPVNYEWPSHKIKTFRNGTYDNYVQARCKAKLAEETSDLNSDSDAAKGGVKRRKIIKKIISDSESEPEDAVVQTLTLRAPPKLTKPRAPQMTFTPQPISGCRAVPVTSNPLYSSTPKSVPVFTNNRLSTNQTYEQEEKTRGKNGQCTKSCKNCCDQYIGDSQIKDLTTQCHLIRSIVTDISNDIRELKNKSTSQAPTDNHVSFYETIDLDFPLTNEADLNQFERYLSQPDNYELVVKELSRSGGSKSYDFIKRVMTPLISNKLAEKFNWEGKKGKMKFKELNIAKLILEADTRAKVSSTLKEAEQSIVAWLKRAKEREARVQKSFALNE